MTLKCTHTHTHTHTHSHTHEHTYVCVCIQVLQGDIVPSLDLLRQQCGQYNEWAKLSSQAEQLKRIIVAYDFCECLKWVVYLCKGGVSVI